MVDPTTFNVLDFDATDDPCGFFEDQFENDYFSFFFPGTTMTAIISDDGNGEQSLQLHGGPFTTLTFRNVPILSTSEIKLINIAITPNPVSEMLFISSEEIIIETIRIYNLYGRLLKDEKAKSTSMDVSTLPPGLYLIEVSTAKGSTTEKFVKK